MYKELIIAIIILATIFIIDYVSQKYTDTAVQEINEELNILKESIKKEEINNEKAIETANQIYEKILQKHKTLAYFIEHNELEKVETNFVSGKSYIETKKYEEAICELEKTAFVLEHINDKYSFNLENIF